jgi:hypothetical protein
MKPPFPTRTSALAFLSCCSVFLFQPDACAGDFVAVSSKVSNGYVRTKLPDGTFVAETYAFKEGGYLSGRLADDTIDKMTFASVARTIAGPLAIRNYVPAADPKAARLLIVVYWGTTRAPAEASGSTPMSQGVQQDIPPSPPKHRGYYLLGNEEGWSVYGAVRAQGYADKMINEEDATMLGYDSATDPELRNYRYFVVLLAYDMRVLLKDKKEKLLWQTRFSMDEHQNRFDMQLKPMVLEASAYFGRDSFGLKHDPVPEGHVEIGDVKSLGAVPDPSTSAVLAPDGAHVAYLMKGKDGLELAVADLDRQELHSAGDIPYSNGQPIGLAWLDAGRVVAKLSGSELLVFNDRGERVDFDPQGIGPAFSGLAGSVADDASESRVQALAEEKLPDRKVVILGADKARRRYLLIATDQTATGRFFVYDRSDDLLYEIGRSVSAK